MGMTNPTLPRTITSDCRRYTLGYNVITDTADGTQYPPSQVNRTHFGFGGGDRVPAGYQPTPLGGAKVTLISSHDWANYGEALKQLAAEKVAA